MAKKDEAFELFSQGKTPDSPEVVALGLAKASNKRYYRLWKEGQTPQIGAPKADVKAPVVPRGVPVSSLAIGAKFEYKGTLYQKRDSTLTIVSGLDLKATEITKQMTWRGFPPSTLVTPI